VNNSRFVLHDPQFGQNTIVFNTNDLLG